MATPKCQLGMAQSKPTSSPPTTMIQVFSQQTRTSQNLCHNIDLPSRARVVKLVDAGDSKSPAARRAGSIPAPGTIGISYRPDSIARHQTYE